MHHRAKKLFAPEADLCRLPDVFIVVLPSLVGRDDRRVGPVGGGPVERPLCVRLKHLRVQRALEHVQHPQLLDRPLVRRLRKVVLEEHNVRVRRLRPLRDHGARGHGALFLEEDASARTRAAPAVDAVPQEDLFERDGRVLLVFGHRLGEVHELVGDAVLAGGLVRKDAFKPGDDDTIKLLC
jgi:hypothetical protein